MEVNEPIRLNIQITESKAETLDILEDDDIEEVIEQFCNRYKLDEDQKRLIYKTVLDILEERSSPSESQLNNILTYSMPSHSLNPKIEMRSSVNSFTKSNFETPVYTDRKDYNNKYDNEQRSSLDRIENNHTNILSKAIRIPQDVKSQDESLKVFNELNLHSDQKLYKESVKDLYMIEIGNSDDHIVEDNTIVQDEEVNQNDISSRLAGNVT